MSAANWKMRVGAITTCSVMLAAQIAPAFAQTAPTAPQTATAPKQPPPAKAASTIPWMWEWFAPTTPNRSRGAALRSWLMESRTLASSGLARIDAAGTPVAAVGGLFE